MPLSTGQHRGAVLHDGAARGGTFLLHVGCCYTPQECIRDACILCNEGLITAVGGASAFAGLDSIPRIVLPEALAVPGFIDTHLHGGGGCDLMLSGAGADLTAMSAMLAAHGVTSFLPTLVSAAPAALAQVVATLARECHDEHSGAVPVGLNLEGPFLNVLNRGVQDQDAIRAIDLGEVRELAAAAAGHLRMMTFAPELEGAEALVALLRELHVVPSMGHTLADEAAALRAIDAGATRCTHFYNGMPKLDQRDAGLTAVALTDERVTIELIADGIHVHPRMINLACRAKPKNLVIGTSDSTAAAGLEDGVYRFRSESIRVAGGSCRRVSDGRLAGSCLSIDCAVRNLRAFAAGLFSERDAIACYTLHAAHSIGLDDRGLLLPGKRADITVLDANWDVLLTIVRGRVVYSRDIGRGFALPEGMEARLNALCDLLPRPEEG
jgi:N-acetylglucosamine-6-phosphate deacetylase